MQCNDKKQKTVSKDIIDKERRQLIGHSWNSGLEGSCIMFGSPKSNVKSIIMSVPQKVNKLTKWFFIKT